jgi:hypothetical protein
LVGALVGIAMISAALYIFLEGGPAATSQAGTASIPSLTAAQVREGMQNDWQMEFGPRPPVTPARTA